MTLPVSEAGLDTVQVKGRRTRGSPRNIHRAQRAGRKGGAQGVVPATFTERNAREERAAHREPSAFEKKEKERHENP